MGPLSKGPGYTELENQSQSLAVIQQGSVTMLMSIRAKQSEGHISRCHPTLQLLAVSDLSSAVAHCQ